MKTKPPDDLIPKMLYSFYAQDKTISCIGLFQSVRRSLLVKYLHQHFYQDREERDRANKELGAFLNKYLTCLKD
jgi:hypothetical protein